MGKKLTPVSPMTCMESEVAMKRMALAIIVLALVSIPNSISARQSRNRRGSGTEVFTGTILNREGKMISYSFTLRLNGRTSHEESQRYLTILDRDGQTGLMRAVRNNNFGSFTAAGQTRRNLLFVQESQVGGTRRIIAAFERWIGVREARAGLRTMDHPFSTIELNVDQRGRGTGTFIGLARIRMDRRAERRVEVVSYGTFPARITGVRQR